MSDLKGFVKLEKELIYLLEGNVPGSPYKCKAGKAAIQCLNCDDGYIFEPCHNCGGEDWESGFSSDGVLGMFCKSCQKGFTYNPCAKCGTENPVNKYTLRFKPCYIITATTDYGSIELETFYFFRDEYLTRNKVGELFIKLYYYFSPKLANIISKNSHLRKLTYFIFVKPCYRLINVIYKQKE